jgi:hypothetical protein
MKNTVLALILTLSPAFAGCLDFDFTGIGSGLGAGYGGSYTPTLSVSGEAFVGSSPILVQEAIILLFTEGDTSTPVDSVGAQDEGYYLDFGATPDPDVCSLLVRARRWDGELSPIVPLFAQAPATCGVGHHAGSTLELPEYPPLSEPFVLRGRVLLGDRPAGSGEVAVQLYLRRDGLSHQPTSVSTDEEGAYSYETTDRATWFAACRGLHANAVIDGSFYEAWLGHMDHDDCMDSRTLPDIRIGWQKAAEGRVVNVWTGRSWNAADGAVEVRLEHLSDTTVAPVVAQLLDDAHYHVWFPLEFGAEPGCDWKIAVFVAGVPALEQVLDAGGYGCTPPYFYDLPITPGEGLPPGAVERSVIVDDPRGDHTGLTDIRRMDLRFDASTGAYTLVLTADPDAMFQDSIRINVNLYNPEAGTFFSRTMVDRRFDTPVSEVVLRGRSSELQAWQPGQEVFTNSLDGTPNPPGATLFRSSVNHFPLGFLTNEDVITFENRATPAIVSEPDP